VDHTWNQRKQKRIGGIMLNKSCKCDAPVTLERKPSSGDIVLRKVEDLRVQMESLVERTYSKLEGILRQDCIGEDSCKQPELYPPYFNSLYAEMERIQGYILVLNSILDRVDL
jgi:hypothetical protein